MNRGPVALNILQGWAEAAQQIITNSPISYIRVVMTQGCGGMLLARGKKWWWITWLLTGSSSSVEVRLDEFISGLAEADNTVTKTGSHGTDWDSSRRRTRYQTLHPRDRLHQHLAKSTSQVSTWKYSQESSDKRYNQWMHGCVMNKNNDAQPNNNIIAWLDK